MRTRDRYGTYGTSVEQGTDWHDRAECKQVDPEIFFPTLDDMKGQEGAEKGAYARAQEVCRRCPVWEECRQDALDNDERFGMWGGMTPRQRRREINRRTGS